MHTFDFGKAISEGFSAFGKKAVPLILITLIGGGLTLLVQVVLIGSAFSGFNAAEINSNGEIEIESRFNDGVEAYTDILKNASDYEGNEEQAARDIAEGFGFDYDQLEAITADGEVSDFEALSAYSGSSFNPFGGMSFGKILLGGIISAIIGLFFGIAMITASLDAVFDRKFAMENITKNFSKMPAYIVFGILIFLLSLINIIPILGFIIYFIVYLMIIQTPFIIIEEGKGAIESMKRSNELMSGNKLRMLALLIVLGLVAAILGTITVGIGYLVILPVMACIMASTYKQLSQGPVAAAAEKVKGAVK